MDEANRRPFPRWLFAIIAVGGLLACGIFIGIMSIEGTTGMRLAQAAGYGVLGLLTFWGAVSPRGT